MGTTEHATGVERVIAAAAVDEELEAALLAGRLEGLERHGIELTPTEERLLAAAGRPALERMIASVRQRLDRRAFFGKSAAAVLTALGAGAAALAACPGPATGARPDPPPPRNPPPPADATESKDEPDARVTPDTGRGPAP